MAKLSEKHQYIAIILMVAVVAIAALLVIIKYQQNNESGNLLGNAGGANCMGTGLTVEEYNANKADFNQQCQSFCDNGKDANGELLFHNRFGRFLPMREAKTCCCLTKSQLKFM